MQAGKGGSGAPFTFVKKISTPVSDLGSFGDFVINSKYEKDAKGTKTLVDKGINLGTEFDVVFVSVGYRYTQWDEASQRTLSSNAMTDLGSLKTAVNAYTGVPLPTSKEDKKAAGWKLNKVCGILVRKDKKSDWSPAIWELSGKMFFTLNNIVGSGGLLDGIYSMRFATETKGSTMFTVIDEEKSTNLGLPALQKLFTDKTVTDLMGEVSTKMAEYRASQQFAGADTGSSANSSVEAPVDSDGADW